jgi:hypothetical protein
MIVTTNLRYDELIEQLGERTVSRLVAICGDGLPLFGEDDRLQHRPSQRAEVAAAPDALFAEQRGSLQEREEQPAPTQARLA